MRGTPERVSSSSPARPLSRYRLRQPTTVTRDTPTLCAIEVFDSPSAANNRIRDRRANGSRNWRVSRRGAEHVGCARRGVARTQAKASTSRLKVASAGSTSLSPWKKTASSIFISLEASQLSVSVVPDGAVTGHYQPEADQP